MMDYFKGIKLTDEQKAAVLANVLKSEGGREILVETLMDKWGLKIPDDMTDPREIVDLFNRKILNKKTEVEEVGRFDLLDL
jgi:hypothetical protein